MTEEIKLLAYAIWEVRSMQGDPNAGDTMQNYLRAKHCLMPGELTIEETQKL